MDFLLKDFLQKTEGKAENKDSSDRRQNKETRDSARWINSSQGLGGVPFHSAGCD